MPLKKYLSVQAPLGCKRFGRSKSSPNPDACSQPTADNGHPPMWTWSQMAFRQSWWWVFGLCIALPAVALALLGLTAIRADDVEQQLACGSSKAVRPTRRRSSCGRLRSRAHDGARDNRPRHERLAARGLPFEVDTSSVVWFPADRVYAGDIHSDDPAF